MEYFFTTLRNIAASLFFLFLPLAVTAQEDTAASLTETSIVITDTASAEVIPLTWQQRITQNIDSIVTVALPKKNPFTIGCAVYDLTADSMIYTRNADIPYIPASTQKMFTATAVLQIYGAETSSKEPETPLQNILTRMLKESDNNSAEVMLSSIVTYNEQWSLRKCCNTVEELVRLIRKMYHPEWDETASLSDYYAISDGSGLSRNNRTTAVAQIDLLRFIYHDKRKLFQPMMRMLPLSSVDGTLKSRMHDSSAQGTVHAKTGTLNGVSTLTGYLKNSEGHTIAFTILINNCSNRNLARMVQDSICIELTK